VIDMFVCSGADRMPFRSISVLLQFSVQLWCL